MTESPEWTIEVEVQEALVRLWTSDEARAAFLSDRAAYLVQLPISMEARDRLRQLDAGQLDGFAASLVQKRLSQARALLADVALRMPTEFEARFSAWAAAHLPAPSRDHEEDAWRFGATLLQGPLAPELRDRLRWRRLLLGLQRSGWRLGLTLFRHDIRLSASPELPRRITLVLWWSLPGRRRGTRVVW